MSSELALSADSYCHRAKDNFSMEYTCNRQPEWPCPIGGTHSGAGDLMWPKLFYLSKGGSCFSQKSLVHATLVHNKCSQESDVNTKVRLKDQNSGVGCFLALGSIPHKGTERT